MYDDNCKLFRNRLHRAPRLKTALNRLLHPIPAVPHSLLLGKKYYVLIGIIAFIIMCPFTTDLYRPVISLLSNTLTVSSRADLPIHMTSLVF